MVNKSRVHLARLYQQPIGTLSRRSWTTELTQIGEISTETLFFSYANFELWSFARVQMQEGNCERQQASFEEQGWLEVEDLTFGITSITKLNCPLSSHCLMLYDVMGFKPDDEPLTRCTMLK